jgi:hypothetical protein
MKTQAAAQLLLTEHGGWSKHTGGSAGVIGELHFEEAEERDRQGKQAARMNNTHPKNYSDFRSPRTVERYRSRRITSNGLDDITRLLESTRPQTFHLEGTGNVGGLSLVMLLAHSDLRASYQDMIIL